MPLPSQIVGATRTSAARGAAGVGVGERVRLKAELQYSDWNRRGRRDVPSPLPAVLRGLEARRQQERALRQSRKNPRSRIVDWANHIASASVVMATPPRPAC
jgi:hypothetical protein